MEGKVDLTSWRHKVDEDEREDDSDQSEEVDDDDQDDDVEPETDEEVDTAFDQYLPFKGGSLTIGCCGIPNVGKSSVMNALIGKKVVSVSKTPGHTKHFQTYVIINNTIIFHHNVVSFNYVNDHLLFLQILSDRQRSSLRLSWLGFPVSNRSNLADSYWDVSCCPSSRTLHCRWVISSVEGIFMIFSKFS